MKFYYLILICCFLVFCCKTIYIQESSLISPTKLGQILPNEKVEEFWIIDDKDSLNSLHFKNPNSNKVILFFHGSGGSIWNDYAFNYFRTLRNNIDVNVFSIDYSGFGKSSGNFSISNLKREGVLAYDYLKNNLGYSSDSIIVMGFSLGSAVASRLSTERMLNNLILIATFTNAEDVLVSFQKSISFPQSIFIRLKLSSDIDFDITEDLNNSQNPNLNLLIVHGEQDETIPINLAYKLYDNVSLQDKKIISIQNVGHNNILEKYIYYLDKFIKDIE